MKFEFKLPDIGEGVVEGEIVGWLVAEGDAVVEDQPIAEVLTDKATVEIPSPKAGTVVSLPFAAGDTVPVGNVLIVLDVAGEDGPVPAPTAPEAPAASPKAPEPKAAPEPVTAQVRTAAATSPATRFEFKLPDIGEGVVEGEIVGWLVAEGDTVVEDQPIAEVLTDKATVEIPSPKAGTVVSLPFAAGDTVPVGSVLIVLEVAGEDGAAPAAPETATAAPKTPEPQAAPKPITAPASTAAATSPATTKAQHRPATVAASGPSTTGRALAAPATRRVARELGVDVSTIVGTGKNGRVTKADVERAAGMGTAPAQPSTAAAAAPKAAPAPTSTQRYAAPTAPAELEERTPLKGLRKAIADNMVKSAFTAPHFTYVEEIDVTDLVNLRKRLRPLAQERGTDLTFLPIIMKAIVAMLKKHPILNASLDDAAQEIVVKHYYNLGIAVATERGLIVPVVKNVDQKGLLELAQEVTDLSAKARKMRLSQDDLTGSTFTITSLGKLGGILATPILNVGEVAILGVHRIIERPMYVNGEVVPRKLMNVSLSFDHRVVDGYDGAFGVQTLREILENPDLLMLEMR